MDLKLRSTDLTPPLIRSFYTQMPSLKSLLLSENALKSRYGTKLFIVLGKDLSYVQSGRGKVQE